MHGHRHRADRRESAKALAVAFAIAGVLMLASCGGVDESTAALDAATASPAPPTPPPPPTASRTAATTALAATSTTTGTTTGAATTTTTPTTTISTTSTIATTSTAPLATIALEHGERVATEPSGPIPPPSDSHAAEPIVEIGTISIPKIGVEMTMFEGIRLTTLDHGPGHWPGSALPGADGNVVVGGHRVSKHQVFRNVDQLVAGDEIIFSDAGGTHVYQVDRVEIVEPTDIWIIDPTDTPTATLFACHPPGSTSQRIAVFADLVG